MTPGKALDQINRLIAHLVEVGLADDQRFAFRRNKEVVEITFDSAELITQALKGISHTDVYENFVRDRVFNAKLLDGALIQMMYMFSDNVLIQHRLAFLSAPHLNRFADDEDAYLNDELYVEILEREADPMSLRFDYDSRDGLHTDLLHPKSHLTLGGYGHCRIPVSSPLTPYHFIDFILRNFYRTDFTGFADDLPRFSDILPASITLAERRVVHVVVPS